MAILISAHTLNSRFPQLVISILLFFGALWIFNHTFSTGGHHRKLHPPQTTYDGTPISTLPAKPKGEHPIDTLIHAADKHFNTLLKKESTRVSDAAKAYRKRRGRQPPPGFDKWFEFAQKSGAIVIEDFFDRIYHDLRPFWGASPNQLRNSANSFENRVSVRDQTVFTRTYDDAPREQMEIWRMMLEDIIMKDGWLPDVDLPINIMDETRVAANWEDVREHVARETESRKIVHTAQLKTTYQRLEALDKLAPGSIDPVWHSLAPYWNLAMPACPPESPARRSHFDDFDYTHTPQLTPHFPPYSYHGYIQNWTFSKSVCDLPNFQSLLGNFVEPISIATTSKLIPLFSSTKLSINNEILLPSPWYWAEDKLFAHGEPDPPAWETKSNKAFWRGQASGGRNREENWTHFHRHRFVNLNNATVVRSAEDGEPQLNFVLPDKNDWDLAVRKANPKNGSLADWVENTTDVGLVSLNCFPDDDPPNCNYTDPYFHVVDGADAHVTQWAHKYLPDIDGNGFSARFEMLLDSTSLPIKATVYNEWHDDRLVPWKHFVPMDNTYIDYYGILDYFAGDPDTKVAGHDAMGKNLAMNGKLWSERVLRRDDMLVYMYRVVLEFARLCHDSRYKMGWSEDL